MKVLRNRAQGKEAGQSASRGQRGVNSDWFLGRKLGGTLRPDCGHSGLGLTLRVTSRGAGA